MKKLAYIISLFFLFLMNIQSILAQCTQCKAAAASRDEAGNLIVGGSINTGVLYLLAMPFVLIFFVGGVWWWKSRQLAKQV